MEFKPLVNLMGIRCGLFGRGATLMLVGSLAYADQQPDVEQENALGPLYINARQEGEDVKDLAFSVDVVGADEIEDSRYSTLEGVLASEPSVNIYRSGGANVSNIYIRGVGALYPMSMDDSSVAVMLDGSPISSRNISLGTLDTERVEILKGPQGTLFGGLGEAGGINISSRKPTSYQEGYVRAEYGEEAQYLLEGALSGPLAKNLSGRLALRSSGYDNWVKNAQTGQPMNSPHQQAVRGSVLWDASERTSLLLSAEHHQLDDMAEMFVLRPYTSHPVVSLTPGLYDDDEKSVKRYLLKLSHDFDHSQFSATSGYTHSYNIAPVAYGNFLNNALSNSPEYWQTDESREKVFTQDVRLSSLPGAEVFWATGVSLSQSERSYDTPYNIFGSANAIYRDFSTDRYGVYGETTFPVAQAWDLTTGLRYSWEERDYDGRFTASDTLEHRDLEDDFFTGRVGVGYDLSQTLRFYSTLARGYNPGGFNDYATQPIESTPYKAAKVNSLEFGVKKASLDGKYRLTGAIFYNQVKDNHLLSYDSQTFISSVVNADTRSLGAELSAMVALNDQLTLQGGVSYTDATVQTNLVGVGGGDVDKGNRVPDVSRWSGKMSVAWKKPVQIAGLTDSLVNTRLSWAYTGTRSADVQNHFDLGAYNLVDLHLGLNITNAEFYLWGSNLLDADYDLYGYYPTESVTYGAPGRGRTLGAGVRYDW